MVGGSVPRWVALKMRLDFLSVGQFNDDALEALVVELRAGGILHADAPGNPFLPHEPAGEDASRAASASVPHHIGGDEQRLAVLRLG